ncbi:MAG: copper resistance protein B [Pseudoxanthomonas sp.]
MTDADRAAAFPALSSMHAAHGSGVHSLVLFDRLEAWDADHGHGQAWDGSAWIGGDIDRLWLRSEGERRDGHNESAELEALYGHAISPWWDLLAGLRQDFAPGPARQWAALGVQGLAPYKFEVSATAYIGASGRTAARLQVEYELLLSQRLILQPQIELVGYGQDDPQRRLGAGLAAAQAGLRLRYEFNRRFAPYLGVERERRFGASADYAREDGESPLDTRLVAGVRVWF